MMNKLLISTLILLSTLPVHSSDIKYRKTKCNVYYNNMGKVFDGTSCEAWFNSNKNLVRVNVYLPHVKKWFDWGVDYSNVSSDIRWKECLRHTGKEGNQYQVCTQQSPEQLGI